MLPRPWDPPTCVDPDLRAELWEWLEAVVTWLNHEYVWDVSGIIPHCWPKHPHLVHEVAVLADLRRRAGQALSSDALEEWPGTSFAYLPSYFGVDLRVTVAGNNAAGVRDTVLRAYNELMAKVRNVVYAEGGVGMEEVVGACLRERSWRIATAESCTGGLLAKRITDTPGSSAWFERGFVTYANAAKLEQLGVDEATLDAQGAVSAAVAEQMAAGARERANVEVGVGITGVAGPDGGSENKPVGTVYIALVTPLGTVSRVHRLLGSRATVRERAAQTALDMLRRHLLEIPVDPSLD